MVICKSWRQFTASIISMMLLLQTATPLAQQLPTEVLDDVQVDDSGFNAVITIQFKRPVQYLSHSPENRGDTINIRVSLIDYTSFLGKPRLENESITLDSRSGLREVIYENSIANTPYLLLYFTRPVTYEVIQGSDQRSLSIIVYGIE